MPRANRYYQPGYIFHLTHRCHDRKYLFNNKRLRKRYLSWLYKANKKYPISVLNYIVTSNHIHILAAERRPGSISKAMQYASGRFAQEYNVNLGRQGAFWSDRYHATIIDSGSHLLRCMIYIDLNMVRAKIVTRPYYWHESGFNEIQSGKTKFRILDLKRLIEVSGLDFDWWKTKYPQILNQTIEKGTKRNPIWTESIAVGRTTLLAKLECVYQDKQLMIHESSEGIDFAITTRYASKNRGILELEE